MRSPLVLDHRVFATEARDTVSQGTYIDSKMKSLYQTMRSWFLPFGAAIVATIVRPFSGMNAPMASQT